MQYYHIGRTDDIESMAACLMESCASWNPRELLLMLNSTKLDLGIAARIAGSMENIVIAEEGDRIVGILNFQYQKWESEVFERPFHKVSHLLCATKEPRSRTAIFQHMLRVTDALMSNAKGSVLVARVSGSDWGAVEALVKRGFVLVESRLVFERFPSLIPLGPGAEVRPSAEADVPFLARIAEKNFHHSRFHADSSIPRRRANRSRSEWVRNACEGRLDGAVVYVSCEADKPAGFVVCKDKTSHDGMLYGVLDLIAVDRQLQRRGHGSNLVRMFLGRYAGKCPFVLVATQAHNIPSVRLYENEGFRLSCVEFTFHKHFK